MRDLIVAGLFHHRGTSMINMRLPDVVTPRFVSPKDMSELVNLYHEISPYVLG